VAITTQPGAGSTDLTTLLGTELADTFTLKSNDLYVDGLAGADTITAAGGVEKITVVSGGDNDTLTFSGELLSSSLTLGQGADKVAFQDFSGSVFGGEGNDTLTQGATRSTTGSLLRGDAGNDNISVTNLTDSTINSNSDDVSVTVTGTSTNSSIFGGRQRDTITVLNASGGLIRGDANEDKIEITGTISGVVINGNADDDQIIISATKVSNSSIHGGGGKDNIDISSGQASLVFGDKGNDDIDVTSSQTHTINGGDGDDAIDSSSTKAQSIDGGTGKDVITLTGVAASSAVHSVIGGTGKDSITGTTGKESLDGGSDADTLVSAGGNDTILGRAGADLITLGAAGKVEIRGGADNDVIELVASDLTFEDTIKGDNGTDTIAFVGDALNFDMTAANTAAEKSFDNISTVETLAFGTKNAAYLVATEETITLSSKAQTAGLRTFDAKLATGADDDVLNINASKFSSSANLTFIGADDEDVKGLFTGGAGNDTLTTGKASQDAGDSLTGGSGLDTFNVVASGVDTEIEDLGKGGQDVLVVTSAASGANADVTVDWVATSATSNSKALADVKLVGAAGVSIDVSAATGAFGYDINGGGAGTGALIGNTLAGSSFNDSIDGGAANDSLAGNGGNDTIGGGTGDDTINAGAGADKITDAGSGADVIIYDSGTTLDIQNTGVGVVTLTATVTGATVTGTDALAGTVNASTSTAAVVMDGSAETSEVITYTGGTGNDLIKGGAAIDVLTGTSGNDTIEGGLQADVITIGTGTNQINFTGGITQDAIVGYTADDVGAFDLSSLETVDLVVTGTTTLDFINGNGTSVAAGDTIAMQTVAGATTLNAGTNVLNFTAAKAANAAALELLLEGSSGLVTSAGVIAASDAFVIQYQDDDTDKFTYAIGTVTTGVGSGIKVAAWEVTDIATTDLTSAFAAAQFAFIA
jgi:Ca2+-binding RTX toxin-like protein